MNFFVDANERSHIPPRVHPLLLSLTATYDKSDQFPDINAVSEDDPRIWNNDYYTPACGLPPLEIHFPCQNSTPHSLIFMFPCLHGQIDSCPGCMTSEAQQSSVEVGVVAFNPGPSALDPKENVREVEDVASTVPSNRKKRRRPSSGRTDCEFLVFIGMCH